MAHAVWQAVAALYNSLGRDFARWLYTIRDFVYKSCKLFCLLGKLSFRLRGWVGAQKHFPA